MATYATVEDFEAYVIGWQTDDEAALEAILVKAERDIDRYLMSRDAAVDEITGLLISVIELEDTQALSLSNAVCAQAEYRLAKGEDFFVEKQFRVGEFATTSAKEPRLAPKAKEELEFGKFLSLTGRMT